MTARTRLRKQVMALPLVPMTRDGLASYANGRTVILMPTGRAMRYSARGWRRVGGPYPLIDEDWFSTDELIDWYNPTGPNCVRVMTAEQAALALWFVRKERQS